MENKLQPSNTQKRKIYALRPILDKWNKVQNDNWEIVPFLSEGYRCDTCVIRERPPKATSHIHGLLMTDIAGICNAYEWTWAVYPSLEHGIVVDL